MLQQSGGLLVWGVVFLLFRITHVATGQKLMPAMFILGDSLVDSGNNDYFLTLAKSNFLPNGIDFEGGRPTGRFCNGRTVADILVQKLGLQTFPPPYLAPTTRGSVILRGVNYASAAGGILDSTGYNYIGRKSLNAQLSYLSNTRSQFINQVGLNQTNQIFTKSLFYVTIGSNDYINNYLLTDSPTSRQYTPQQYQNLLISTLKQQLTTLYNLGARKIFVFGVGPLGCIPSQLYSQKSPNGQCIGFVNSYVRGYNAALQSTLKQLSATLSGATFVYGNSYDLVFSYINNPSSFGFSLANRACCGGGPYKGFLPCLPTVAPCTDRTNYVFWDPFHPTEATNLLLAGSFFAGGIQDSDPINIKQLAAL